MADRLLLLRRHLAERAPVALDGLDDRVVAEPTRAPRARGDATLDGPPDDLLTAVGPDRGRGAHVAAATTLRVDPVELAQHSRDPVRLRGPAGRVDPRGAAEVRRSRCPSRRPRPAHPSSRRALAPSAARSPRTSRRSPRRRGPGPRPRSGRRGAPRPPRPCAALPVARSSRLTAAAGGSTTISLLQLDDLADARLGQLQHHVELLAAVGRALGRALHLDEAARARS